MFNHCALSYKKRESRLRYDERKRKRDSSVIENELQFIAIAFLILHQV